MRTRDTAVLGAVGWWAFEVGVLWAWFEAFGEPPAVRSWDASGELSR